MVKYVSQNTLAVLLGMKPCAFSTTSHRKYHTLISRTMACDCCKSIDLDRLIKGEIVAHHATFRELSVCYGETDCQMCGWIKCDLEEGSQRDGIRSSLYEDARIIYSIPSYSLAQFSSVESWHGISVVLFKLDMPGRYFGKYFASLELFVDRGNFKPRKLDFCVRYDAQG
jgi:hypothetical protein